MKRLIILVLLISANLWAKGTFSVGAHGDIMRFTSYDKYVGGGGAILFYQRADFFKLGFSVSQYQWGSGVERPAPGYDFELKRERLSFAFSFRTFFFKKPTLFPYLNALIGQEKVTTKSVMNYYSLENFSVVATSKYKDNADGVQLGLGLGSEIAISSKLNLDLNGTYLSSQYTNDHFLLTLGINYQF